MKRKMVIIGISYILGLFFASFFAKDSFGIYLILGIAIGVILVAIKAVPLKAALTAAISFTVGFTIYLSYTVNYYTPVISKAGEETVFVGRVKSANTYAGDTASYILEGQFDDGTEGQVICFTDNNNCRYGDYMRVTGTFSHPMSTFLYDSNEYYKGMSVFLEADPGCTYDFKFTDNYSILRKIQFYREKIQRRFYSLCGRNGGSLVSAMIFGNKQGLDESVESAFYHAGLGPMLALSGFHLVLFSGICNIFGKRFRLQRIISLFMTIFMVLLFALLSMWPVSVLRAGIMLLIAKSSCLFFRQSDSLSSLLFSVIVLTCTQPYLIHSVSFLLSVTATFGINNLAPWLSKKMTFDGILGSMVKNLMYSPVVMLCTLPVCIKFFPRISLLAPISNVIFTPLCIIIMVTGIIIFFLGGNGLACTICGRIIDAVGDLLSDGLLYMQGNISASFSLGWESIQKAVYILIIMTLIVYAVTKMRKAVIASAVLSVFIMFTGQYMLEKDFDNKLRIFIVGRNNGHSAVITYAGRTDVIDISYDRKNADCVRNLLYEYNIDKINCLYLVSKVNAAGATFREKLAHIKADSVLMTSGGEFGEDLLLCKERPCIADNCKISGSAYEISVNDGSVILEAYGKKLLITQADNNMYAEEKWDYLALWGKNTCDVYEYGDENSGWLMYSDAGNIEIVMNEENINVRRLY